MRIQGERRAAALQWTLKWIMNPPNDRNRAFAGDRLLKMQLIRTGVFTEVEEAAIIDAFRRTCCDQERTARSVFRHACQVGSLALVKFLSPRCEVNCAEVHHASPILEAVRAGNIEIVQCILSATSSPPSADVSMYMLKQAVMSGNSELVEFLLERASGRFDVNSPNMVGWSLLEIAVEGDHVEMVSLLLSYGAKALYSHAEATRHVCSLKMAKLLDDHGSVFDDQAATQAATQAARRKDKLLLHFILSHGTIPSHNQDFLQAA